VREVWEETGIHCRAEREIASRIHPTSAARIHYWLCPFVSAKRQQPEFPLVWARVEHLESMAGATLFPLVKRELERSTGDQLSRTTFSTASP
jgi:8-oxo-dGTP pyrophosphatase MutT (NUDIX family)